MSKIFGTRLGPMIPGFSNHGLSGLLSDSVNNEKETSNTHIFSFKNKPTPPLDPKRKQRICVELDTASIPS